MRTTHRLAVFGAAGCLLLSACGALTPAAEPTIRQSVDVSAFTPTAKNPDPSKNIDGVTVKKYPKGKHIRGDQRVAYTFTPPIGGTHDQAWATCTGVVYPEPVRSENIVHSMEHGAVWIAYDADRVSPADQAALAKLVDGKPYMVMSPYPGMKHPISLQSWGHQLAVDSIGDERIDQFIAALRRNPNTFPEPDASCAEIGGQYFQQDNPPAFKATPAKGEVNGGTIVEE